MVSAHNFQKMANPHNGLGLFRITLRRHDETRVVNLEHLGRQDATFPAESHSGWHMVIAQQVTRP